MAVLKITGLVRDTMISLACFVGRDESGRLPRWLGGGLLALLLGLNTAQAAVNPWPEEVPNFAMIDVLGRYHELHKAHARVVVLFFTENGCPVARQSLHKLKALRNRFSDTDVAIWAVDANTSDNRESIQKESFEMGLGRAFPFLRDDTQGVARMLGITRTATAVAISTRTSKVIYHGSVDDQLSEGASRPAATEKFLENALQDFLSDRPVKVATTQVHGCLCSYDAKLKDADISYSQQVVPILEKHCVQCHSPGNIGPFAFKDYDKVKSKSEMMQEVLLARRMPPWSADAEVGHFVNNRAMTLDETRTLLGWISKGCPRGEGADPLPMVKVPATPEWNLGNPDLIVKLPHPEEVPATGVLEYRHIKLKTPVTEDTWVGAVAIKPGNLKVLHHCIVRVQSKKGPDDGSGRGEWLQGWAPGARAEHFPEGTGRLLAKGSTLDIELHYTTMGSAQVDETEIGLYTLPAPPRTKLRNLAAYNFNFTIEPGAAESETSSMICLKQDSLLYAMSPHMHLRGSWMSYEALYPTGERELLLSVPNYDFNWQTSYNLAQPKQMPAGTWIICRGGFDNSTANPNNPDPKKRVNWGEQSFEEMFIGFMETSEAPKPENATRSGGGL